MKRFGIEKIVSKSQRKLASTASIAVAAALLLAAPAVAGLPGCERSATCARDCQQVLRRHRGQIRASVLRGILLERQQVDLEGLIADLDGLITMVEPQASLEMARHLGISLRDARTARPRHPLTAGIQALVAAAKAPGRAVLLTQRLLTTAIKLVPSFLHALF